MVSRLGDAGINAILADEMVRPCIHQHALPSVEGCGCGLALDPLRHPCCIIS